MEIDKTERLLKKFDYKFLRKNQSITIKLDFSQRVIVDFSSPDKIKIKDKLVAWNLLTGIIEMSIKNALLYNSIILLIITFFMAYLGLLHGVIVFLLISGIWTSLWAIYYLLKAESLKRTLISWNERIKE